MAGLKLGTQFRSSDEIRDRAALAAGALAAMGVGEGDAIALCLRNDFAFFEATFAADMLGACVTPLNWHCSADEAEYILQDSAARVLVIHADLYHLLALDLPDSLTVFVVETPEEIAEAYGVAWQHRSVAVLQSWEELIRASVSRSQPRASMPQAMIYTSGTTGRPKGVRREPLRADQFEAATRVREIMFGAPQSHMVAVVTGPLYHAAPNAFALWMFAIGATVVLQARFDPVELLGIIERDRATHIHMVPTMFVRLLRLPASVRDAADISSLTYVVHGAAPCPDHVKEAMIAWWGPVVHEYYASTETGCVAFCRASEWLERRGTVGRAMPDTRIAILDPEGREVAAGTEGEIACRNFALSDFSYNGDDAKRADADRGGLVSLGDVGYLDPDGYLFLSGRARDMIISGGVNIYPAEIEAALHLSPHVADCAVFGIPDEEFGEKVHAVIQLRSGSPEDAAALQAFLRDRIASFKVPKGIDFVRELPRQDSGKIFKQALRQPFWENMGRTI